MKRILITGANSYIGMSVEKWLQKYPEEYSVNTIDMRNEDWKQSSFKGYDVVFHVAGIAHVPQNSAQDTLYYQINRDLAIATAQKAKGDRVKQFIFMSSIIVYGDSSSINTRRVIYKDTRPEPTNAYGRSKLQAEEKINLLQNEEFRVVILRPPMIYGKNSKGNYPKLAHYAQLLPLFPNVDNQRSMLHIDNLCEFIRLVIMNEDQGTFFPQNAEYVNTAEMVRTIAEVYGKKIALTEFFNPVLELLGKWMPVVNKAFGNLVYDKAMSSYKDFYQIRDLRESIMLTETTGKKVG